MWAEFLEISSDAGVTFEMRGAHFIGGHVRIEGPDGEWYHFTPSRKPEFEWVMGGRDWLDFALVDKPTSEFKVLKWGEVKKDLLEG